MKLGNAFRRAGWLWSLLAVVAVSAMVVGTVSLADVRADEDIYKELKIFTEVLSVVKRSYVEEVKPKDLVYGAIKGMLSSLDPHSGFLSPEAYKEMQVDTRGEFGGLGIQIAIKDGILTIVAPIEDTPAYRAGLKAGDKIVKIEGQSTKDMPIHEAVSMMRGPKGTDITITILREGWKELKDFTITRDIIQIKSVKSKMIDSDVGYVRISQFQERTAEDLSKAMKELNSQGMKSFILDLRNNPGGLLKSAVDVSSRFLKEGKLVVYIQGREGDRTDYKTYTGSTVYEDIPMIVLVNEGSASASEIVAGALKDWKRAVILGMTTFGKGSVQSVIPLSDGAGIRLTTARYYTPEGTSIQLTGIKPDIEVAPETKNGERNHPVIREKDLKGHLDNEQVEGTATEDDAVGATEVAEGDETDTQLDRAVDLLKTWVVFKELPGGEAMPAAGAEKK